MKKGIIILIAIAVILGLFGVPKYNQMIDLHEGVSTQMAQLESVYQRRADLIPNLVNTVKAYKDFEQETLSQIATARAQVGQLKLTADNLQDPSFMEKFQAAQDQLGSSLSRLLVVSENYPDLKANQNFRDLMVQLERTENRVNIERQKYNERVNSYNSYIKRFPNSIFANVSGFQQMKYFEASQGAQQAPSVTF